MAIELVQYTTGVWTDTSIYAIGPKSLTLNNTEGNLLVAYIGLTSPYTTISAITAMPATTVCDSVGNWWRLVGDSGGAPGVITRCAIWVCDNAMAIPSTGWWSVSVAGYTQEFECLVAEFSGVPAGYISEVDFSVPYASATATSLPLNSTTQQADYCFACGICPDNTMTVPGTPWTQIAIPNRLIPLYASFNSPVSVDGTFSVIGGPAAAAGVLIGISQTSYPPWNGNANFPDVKVEAAFVATPGDFSQGLVDAQWTDITSRAISNEGVAGITATRGRQYELATPESGELTVLLNNLDGAFNPAWPGSPYYSNALNKNSSFQYGVADWNALNGATLSQSTAYTFASGVNAVPLYSMQITASGSANPGWQSAGFTPLSRGAGTSYSFSYWVYSPSGWSSGASAMVEWYDDNYNAISSSSSAFAAISAGTWTQVTTGIVTAPVNAIYAVVTGHIGGSPAASTSFYVSEAVFSAGMSGALTGLVKLQTPVRVSAFWQGRRYAISFGFVERWPQSWPDLPQWGFSAMIATDMVGVVNAVNLPSAVQGEIAADDPYACFPFSESYQTTSNTINGAEATASNANGLIAVNTSRTNQQTASYLSGDVPVETGQTLNFEGDSGTGMGTSTYSAFATTPLRGSGAVYGPDPGLPAVGQSLGFTIDFWAQLPSVENQSGTGQYVPLIQLFGKPYINSNGVANLSPGWLLAVGVAFPNEGSVPSGTTSPFIQWSQSADIVTGGKTFPLDTLCYVALDVNSGGTLTTWINDSVYDNTEVLLNGPLTAVTFGGATYSVGTTHARWNYGLAYGTVYQNEIGSARFNSHYRSGATGFAGDPVIVRFGRYQTWVRLNLSEGGPGSVNDAFQLSSAYSTSGSSIATTLNADAQSSGAMWYGNANGNLIVLPRPAMYRLPVSLVFGDNAIRILNRNPDFFAGTSGWSAAAGNVAVTQYLPANAPYVNAAYCSANDSPPPMPAP